MSHRKQFIALHRVFLLGDRIGITAIDAVFKKQGTQPAP
jgi:hypothetical protein